MSVKVTNNFNAVTRALDRAAKKAVAEGAVLFGRMIYDMLSKPGKGRVYVRTKTARKEVRRIGERGARFLTRAQVARLQRVRRSAGLRNRGTRSLGFRKASAPGDPPAAQTGDLRRSWQVSASKSRPVSDGGKYRALVGSNKPYAARMEFGGGGIAPRPYIRPTAQAFRPLFRQIVNREIESALAPFRGKL
jgi:phage gpG-like protein